MNVGAQRPTNIAVILQLSPSHKGTRPTHIEIDKITDKSDA